MTSGSSAAIGIMAEKATVTLIVATYKKSILVTGDTMDAKDALKGAGGSWNRSLKGWIFRPGAKEAILRLASEKITIQNNLADSDAPRDRSRSRERKASTAEQQVASPKLSAMFLPTPN